MGIQEEYGVTEAVSIVLQPGRQVAQTIEVIFDKVFLKLDDLGAVVAIQVEDYLSPTEVSAIVARILFH